MKNPPLLALFLTILGGWSCSPPPPYPYKVCSETSSSDSCRSKTKDLTQDSSTPSQEGEPIADPLDPKPSSSLPGSLPSPVTPKPLTPSPTQNPMQTQQPVPNPFPQDATAELTTTSCAMGETWTFANYPNAWDISKSGRIKDAMPNETVIQDSEKGPVLQVKYGKGTTSPSASRTRGLIPGGTQFVPLMKNSYDHSVMSYWLKIPTDFDCVKGGKLPGIASNIDLISGGETADGTNGFSVRLMWRENCTAEVYAYLPRDANQHLTERYKDTLTQNPTTKIIYGWSIGRGEFSLPKGSWTKIDVSVKVNEVGKKDGKIKVALNGKQVFERSEVVFRTNDKLKTGALFFSTFFGGSDESYAAKKDESLYYGDIAVCPLP